MRLSCCAYSYRDELTRGTMTLEEFIVTCAEMDLDGVELTSYYFPRTDNEYLRHLKRECFRAGLHIAGTAVGSHFTQPDAGKRREQVDMVKDWIDHSVVLGAPCIRVFAGPIPEGHTEDEAVEWAVECLRECALYGASRGVVVALENHGGITSTAAQVERLIREVNHPWLGINLDFGNYRTPYEEYAQSAPHTVTTHAKVSYRTLAGETARVDYGRALPILAAAGYRGYLSIEYEEPQDPRTGVPAFAEELREVLRQGFRATP